MLRRLYNWIISLAEHPRALWVMAAVSFLESSFFPIPPDVMLVPMVLANRKRAWAIAATCTVASVLGGLLGYAIGYSFSETLGLKIVQFYGLQHAMESFHDMFAHYGLWVILIKGLTPIPYKIVTIASGIAHFDLTVFILASILTRGVRFFLLAALLYRYGEPIRNFIEKRLTMVTTVFAVALIGGVIALRYVF
ncbi:YqaA family protein [Dongia soli]|uniref:YqaA family protein n=1 Tax=Dongia soli TaxID=600628 RepID=A0ABU5E4X8_9PROT|nr:YqaA family protein [Dongia soli]MDY0881216.1 YqaA family protein [Dongia soli]